MRALCFIAIAGALLAPAGGPFPGAGALAQNGAAVATLAHAATLTIAPPRSSADIFLNLWVRATPPRQGMAEAVVSLIADGGEAIEVGRFTFFGAAGAPQGYRLDASAAVARLKTKPQKVTVRVALASLDQKVAAQGAEVTLERAEFGPRP